MKDWIAPSANNNYKAHLLKWPITTMWLVLLCLANLVPVNANSGSQIDGQSLLAAHNQIRIAQNLNSLTYNYALANSAQKKATEMLKTDCWSHFCPDNKSPWEFFIESDYAYLHAGENLAEGYKTIKSVMDAWMNSQSHKENILRSDYKEIGFGIVYGNFQGKANNILIVAHFGTQSTLGLAENNMLSAVNTPTITSPESESYLNSASVVINGNANGAESVNLFNNQNLLTSLNVEQNQFTYQFNAGEGIYTLSAQGVKGNLASSRSPGVSFTVDTTPDPVTDNLLTVSSYTKTNQEIVLQLMNKNLKSLQVLYSGQSLVTNKLDNSIWSIQVPKNFNPNIDLFIKTEDLAGNNWEGNVSGLQVSEMLNTFINTQPQVNYLTIFFVAAAFIFIVGLLAIDTYKIQKYGFKNLKVTTSAWQLGLSIAFLLFVLSNSLSGAVGVAINL